MGGREGGCEGERGIGDPIYSWLDRCLRSPLAPLLPLLVRVNWIGSGLHSVWTSESNPPIHLGLV